jgi:hypothetical protein
VRVAGLVLVSLVLLGAAFLFGRTDGDRGSGGGGSGTGAAELGGEGFAVLPTRRCATDLAIDQPSVPVPPRVTVPLSTSLSTGLVAYVDGVGTKMVGPRGWECRATMGADGTETIGVLEPGSTVAPWEAQAGTAAVAAEIVPACAGCMSSLICAFFPHVSVVQAYAAYEDCEPSPEGESSSRISHTAVIFSDPAGTEGAATGSGGAIPSLGVVAFSPRFGARRISCTLPPPMGAACVGIVMANLTLST